MLHSTTLDQWNHINGVQNPADKGIRGIKFAELVESDRVQGLLSWKLNTGLHTLIKNIEQKQMDDLFEILISSEAQQFFGILVTKPID